jgi:hypothetical protein
LFGASGIAGIVPIQERATLIVGRSVLLSDPAFQCPSPLFFWVTGLTVIGGLSHAEIRSGALLTAALIGASLAIELSESKLRKRK